MEIQNASDDSRCQRCGFPLAQDRLASCPRCVSQLSLTELSGENWNEVLCDNFPHLEIIRPVDDADFRWFDIRTWEGHAPGCLHVNPAIEESDAVRAQLRCRSLLEDASIALLEDYGWIDGIFYAILRLPEGADLSLAEALAEGKLSRTEVLAIQAQLREAVEAGNAKGFSIDAQPTQVRLDAGGRPHIISIWPTASPASDDWLRKDHLVGTEIGRYRLERLLGEGGFAEVYLATQQRPVRRPVALKILKSGMDTRQVIGRFETERNLLALLDHPGIAKVYDAGATPAGQPFFAMEYVDGLPLTEFARGHRLSIEARLHLFVKLCQAMQHAHENGVVHRDLKPPNVLVSEIDDAPQLKIIDFGIAKVLGGPLGEHTLYTELNQFVGSPGYMSPEQAELGAQVDHRADIYAMGTLLFELLTGETPLAKERFIGLPHEAKVQLVRETVPESLTQRFRALTDFESHAETLQTSPQALEQHARHGLNEIVRKATRRDPAERYPSAKAFGDTVQTFLKGEFRPTPWWRKIPRPIIWSTPTLCLVVGLVALLSHSHQAHQERQRIAFAPPPVDPARVLSDPTNPPLVWIEPGTMVLGEGKNRRTVTFKKPFALGQFEVTQAEYQAIMSGHRFFEDDVRDATPSAFSEAGPYAPVENVSWHDAVRYCAWLSRLEYSDSNKDLPSGFIYSLPTEEEWEFAVRQGLLTESRKRIAAQHYEEPLLWSRNNSRVRYSGGVSLEVDGIRAYHGTQSVGTSYPNAMGIYDLLGNVSEWMHDFPLEVGGPFLSTNLGGPPTGTRGVVRGGSWASPAEEWEPQWRRELPMASMDHRIGFRVAAVHYERRAYNPIPKYNALEIRDQRQELQIVSEDHLKHPVILDFETLPLGPISAEHPLFQAIGIEGIYLRSSDFIVEKDPTSQYGRMLWSRKADELEVIDGDTPGPFAHSLDYTITFKEPQTVVGFRLSERADRLQIEVGNGHLIETKQYLPETSGELIVVRRNQPFDRLRLLPWIDTFRYQRTIQGKGFGIEQLVLEGLADDVPTNLGHLLTTSRRTSEANIERVRDLQDLELTAENLRLASLAETESEGQGLGRVLRFSRSLTGLPTEFEVQAEGGEWFNISDAPGVQLRATTSEKVVIQFEFLDQECRRLSMNVNLPQPPEDHEEIRVLTNGNAWVRYPLREFWIEDEQILEITLEATASIDRMEVDCSLTKGASVILRRMAFGMGSIHEGRVLHAPHLSPVVIQNGGCVWIESETIRKLTHPNERKVSATTYLRHPATARLPIGGGEVIDFSRRRRALLRGSLSNGTPVYFPMDSAHFRLLNQSRVHYTSNLSYRTFFPHMDMLRSQGNVPPGLPQTFMFDGIAFTLKRLPDGDIQLRASGNRSAFDGGGQPFRLVAGLSPDGKTLAWDLFEDPWVIDAQVSANSANNPEGHWEITRREECPLDPNRGYAYFFTIERLEEGQDPHPSQDECTDWYTWRDTRKDPESVYILMSP